VTHGANFNEKITDIINPPDFVPLDAVYHERDLKIDINAFKLVLYNVGGVL
jgi:hypothetical protein